MYDHRRGRGLGCRCANTTRPWHLLGAQLSRDPLPLSRDLLLPCPEDPNTVGPSSSQPVWMGLTPRGTRLHEGSLLVSTVVGCCFPKTIFAPSPTEVQSLGRICTHRRVLCQHICIIWARICLARSAMGNFRSYRLQRLSCLYCRSHTL